MNAHRAFDQKSSDSARARTEQKAVLGLSQRSGEHRGDGPPDCYPNPERQERYHYQGHPIFYGISVVRNHLAIHQLPRSSGVRLFS
jgi:hypothetical protein